MKISENIFKKLCEHFFRNIQLGIYYAELSLQANSMGMASFAKYIKALSDDKITIHKDKILNYLGSMDLELNGKLTCLPLKKFKDSKAIAEELYKLEMEVRTEVNEIAGKCIQENDFESFNFIQWYVADGIKDFEEIQAIISIFEASKDLLLIDNTIDKILEHPEKKSY